MVNGRSKMKKLILAVLLTLTALASTNASAHGWYGRGAYFAGGIVVGAAIARPYYGPGYYGYYNPPVVYAPPSVVYVQPQPTYYVQQQFPANEYHQEQILDANCNCYRTVYVHN